QGVSGCGFESQLESMYLSLVRAQNANEASYGFLRSNAILAIVFVTDEADCSYNKDWSEIFMKEGNRVFWSNPDANSPSSALCWNAGVQASCHPKDHDSSEQVTNSVNWNVCICNCEDVFLSANL